MCVSQIRATATPQSESQKKDAVPSAIGNVLWECVTLLDDATAEAVEALGGLAAIAISHPHYYASMVAWASCW